MQHFLLSSKAKTLSLKTVFRMSEDEAYQHFCQLRWPENDGEAICPKCGCTESYNITTRRRFKCVACHHQFSVTSGTIFASRKLSFVDLLGAIAIFVNGAKGISALQMSRDLNVHYMTAFVLAHKLREAMALEQQDRRLDGVVEIDGAYFGGHVKPANIRVERVDRREKENKNGKQQCLVIMRERDGKSLAFVVPNEGAAVPIARDHIDRSAIVHADEGPGWSTLHASWETKRINHKRQYSSEDACTNQAESFFSRMRRMEWGTHHHIAGPYLHCYAREASWREDNRRVPNGTQARMVGENAMASPVSRQWKGYWQRAKAA